MIPQEIEKQRVYAQMGMTDEEFSLVKDILGRPPNYTELGLFSVMWSEHCSYKNSKTVLRKFPTKGKRVLQGPGEGAGVVDIGEGLAVVFKLESHNHPSAVEPYHGAATGVGGIIRDVFSMGARPVALLNSLRFGELTNPRVKYLFKEVIAGIAGYGNAVGIPTVGGEIYFDECYASNPLVNAMCVGIIKHDGIRKGVAEGVGNAVMYAGAATGRDGIHGATFASAEISDEKEKPTVQGDPHLEKALIEACLELVDNPALVGIQDMGAAGLISSSSEMASKGGAGIELYLDDVPRRDENMNAYEMMLSESQERMLLVVKEDKQRDIIGLFLKHGLTAVTIGKVTDDGYIRVFHKGELRAEVPADALAKSAPEYQKPSREAGYYKPLKERDANVKIADYGQALLDLLSSPTIASKRYAYDKFDYNARGNTAVPPGSDSGVIKIPGTNKAIAMTVDCNSRYVYLDPYIGGQIAVAEAARNIAASGAAPLAVTDNLNFGSPENPEVFWQLEQAVKGISEACLAFETPVISGNVSLYNESGGEAVYPTPTIGMVGLIEDLSHITTSRFKAGGDLVYILGGTKADFGGSEIQKLMHGEIFGPVPPLDLAEEKRVQGLVLDGIRKGLVKSAHDLSEGGLAVGLAECLFDDENLGLEVDLVLENAALLFAESQSRFIVTVSEENKEAFGELSGTRPLGKVTSCGIYRVRVNGKPIIELPVEKLKNTWRGTIECLLSKEK